MKLGDRPPEMSGFDRIVDVHTTVVDLQGYLEAVTDMSLCSERWHRVYPILAPALSMARSLSEQILSDLRPTTCQDPDDGAR